MGDFSSPKKGSNIICRVSNATPEMVCRYVSRLPKHKMREEDFREYMGKSWFQNEHQAPEQWGLYYIDGTYYNPRFDRDITIEEAERYLYGWIKRLIVINPYTRFQSVNDNRLVESIVKQLEINPDEHDLKTIFRNIIQSDEPFIVNEIIANALNTYSEVLSVKIIDKDNEKFYVSLLPNYKEILKTKYNMTKKEYFDSFNDISIEEQLNNPRQIIYYGAPGTGKSHEVNAITRAVEKETKDNNEAARVFRTTFHPDSDYSTFVGCYKPSMHSKEPIYNQSELIKKLAEFKGAYSCQKFGVKYWESLKKLSAGQIKEILSACGFTESMGVEVTKGIAIGEEYGLILNQKQIIYRFTPQAFTNAYIRAWQTDKPVYLVIEEINRGNCAQIFGDLFQLLDRDEKCESKYPITTDTDLREYIASHMSNAREDIPEEIKSGEKMKLPSNLFIWATMNTSDQSLFPIDSAFKRRWDWKYKKIINYEDKNYQIAIKEKQYSWWLFIDKINKHIGSVTSSEDKKLGYFFVHKDDGQITADDFVSKVLFYLYNDALKDYSVPLKVKNGDELKTASFSDFYDEKGNIIADKVIEALDDFLEVNKKEPVEDQQ